jgi:excisionase family DNA binding protein
LFIKTIYTQKILRTLKYKMFPTTHYREVVMAEKLLLSPDEGCVAIGVKRSTMFKLLASREIPSIKVGRLRRIPVAALHNWVKTQQQEAGNGESAEE